MDLSLVDGFGVSLAQTVTMEVADVGEKFRTEKNFCSWLGLAPKHEISGGKVLTLAPCCGCSAGENKTLKTKNRAGQAFRMAAQSVKKSDSVFGVMYKRFRARQGPSQATVSTAHAIARVVYRMLTLAPHCVWCSAGEYKVEYETISVNEYEKKYEEQQVKYFKKKAAKFGFQLLPA